MATLTLYKQDGTSAGSIELDPTVFEVDAAPALVHEAVVAQQANARVAIAHAKDRGEVRGGGRKPWKQKGTGRARHGSRRSPIWVGGGVTFGPTRFRNFAMKLNRKARRKAICMVLSDKVAHDMLVAVDTLELAEAKTKAVAAMLGHLPSKGKKTLIVSMPENKGVALAARNLPAVQTIPANALNVKDLLAYQTVVASKDAIELLTKTYKRV
jgi:large subunit ribosomal protein L4